MVNCWGCRFALEARGNKVRCTKAEQLFGGERWVKVLEEACCGVYEPFVGDDSRAPDKEQKKKVKATCPVCKGHRLIEVVFLDKRVYMTCYKCKGRGKIDLP
jgi:hypothetical protein